MIKVELNQKAAELLAKLCVELQTDDASGVVVRALGLLEMAQRMRRGGGRLLFENTQGDQAEVAF